MFVFVDLSWRRGLCAKKSRRGTAIDKKNDRRPTQEGARRGRADGRDAWGGRGVSIVIVRHLKVPVLVRDRRYLVGL